MRDYPCLYMSPILIGIPVIPPALVEGVPEWIPRGPRVPDPVRAAESALTGTEFADQDDHLAGRDGQ